MFYIKITQIYFQILLAYFLKIDLLKCSRHTVLFITTTIQLWCDIIVINSHNYLYFQAYQFCGQHTPKITFMQICVPTLEAINNQWHELDFVRLVKQFLLLLNSCLHGPLLPRVWPKQRIMPPVTAKEDKGNVVLAINIAAKGISLCILLKCIRIHWESLFR